MAAASARATASSNVAGSETFAARLDVLAPQQNGLLLVWTTHFADFRQQSHGACDELAFFHAGGGFRGVEPGFGQVHGDCLVTLGLAESRLAILLHPLAGLVHEIAAAIV